MDSTWTIHGLFVLLYIGVSTGQIMTIAPQNLVVLAGEQARFYCQPSDGIMNDFAWSYTESSNSIAMSSGQRIYPPFVNKIQLEANPDTRDYNLLINDTTRADARQYSCDVRFPLMNAFTELILLDREPECSVSTDVSDLVEGESFSVSCEVSYSSKWDPELKCQDVVSGETGQVDNAGSVPGSLLRAALPISSVSRTLHDHSFSCTIRFPAPPLSANIPDDTPTKKYSKNAPIYNFNFNTERFIVQYPVRNLEIPVQQAVYNPGQRIACGAQGRPTVRVRWVNVNTTETDTVGRDLIITEAMEGVREYRCEAENEIRGVTYTVNRTISFTVTIPTTTTPATTTTTTATTTSPAPGPGSRLTAGAIVGIVFGVLAALVILFIILYVLLCRRAPSKGVTKEKQKPRMDGVDQVRRPPPPTVPAKPTNPYDTKPTNPDFATAPNKWGDQLNPPPMYDVALDDTPRSRKPVQVYDSLDYTDFRRV